MVKKEQIDLWDQHNKNYEYFYCEGSLQQNLNFLIYKLNHLFLLRLLQE